MHAPSPQQVTWIARSAGVAMLLLAVFSAYLVATCYEPPVDVDKFFSLHQGLTKEDVIAAIGEPTSIEDDGHRWLYSRFMKVRVVQILFDDDDLLLERGYTDDESGGIQDRGLPDDVAAGKFREDDRSDMVDDAGVSEVYIE